MNNLKRKEKPNYQQKTLSFNLENFQIKMHGKNVKGERIVGVERSPGRRGHDSSNGKRRSLVRNGDKHNNDTKIKTTTCLLCIP